MYKIPSFFTSENHPTHVFETMFFDGKKIHHLDQHIQRLFRSVEICRIKTKVRSEKIYSQLKSAQKRFSQPNRVKLIFDGETAKTEPSKLKTSDLNLDEVEIIDISFERPFPHAKYETPLYQLIKDQQPPNIFETIFFDNDDFLREGNITNVFAIINGMIITPEKNILPGIMRNQVLKTCTEKNIPYQLREINRNELESADEIFLTNSLRGVVPVTKWNNWRTKNHPIINILIKN